MTDYYIKYVWGPDAQKGYPDEGLIHFAKGQEKACQRFKKCKGFLLYETGSKEGGKTGTKTIYAWGVIAPDQPSFAKETPPSRGKRFPYAVKVNLQKRVHPKDGIPLDQTEEIIEKKIMQCRGGLFKITKEQFEKLRSYL